MIKSKNGPWESNWLFVNTYVLTKFCSNRLESYKKNAEVLKTSAFLTSEVGIKMGLTQD
jgi:hypothetical protein